MNKEVILTGLRSNSEFHLGNYLGAILPMVEMQKKHAGQYRLNMFVPDLHSFTTPVDHSALYGQSIKNLKVFVAAGLDINDPDTFIYRQSYIPAHSELTWILDCFSYFGELSRMTEFKEKSGLTDNQKEEVVHSISQKMEEDGIWEKINHVGDLHQQKKLLDQATGPFIEEIRRLGRQKTENASAGLFTYPVLMAADILLYDAIWVPVGEDQRQHLELTRNLALRLNNRFGELFKMPHDWQRQLDFFGLEQGIRIRSLKNPEKKMSKSVSDPAGTIMLTDSPDNAAQKVMSATTDSYGVIKFDWQRQQGITNLLQMLALFSHRPQAEVNSEWEGRQSYGELKSAAAKAAGDFLSDLQSKIEAVDEEMLMRKLADDEAVMNKIADDKLLKVQQAVGLRPKS